MYWFYTQGLLGNCSNREIFLNFLKQNNFELLIVYGTIFKEDGIMLK